jgi:4-hydroxybenzoyl-CoA thioesterase
MKSHRHEVFIHWGDTDPAKIVFYPNYYKWFDESTLYLFESVGFGWNAMMEKFGAPGMPIVEAKANFLSPCRFGDRIVVESAVSEWKEKILKVSHTIYNGSVKSVEGYEIRAFVKPLPEEHGRIKAFPIPAEIRAALE